MNTQPDISHWPTKADVARELGISEKSVERLAKSGKLEQRTRRLPGRRPLVVYNPETVKGVADDSVKATPAVALSPSTPAPESTYGQPSPALEQAAEQFFSRGPGSPFGTFGGLPLDAPFDFESSSTNQETIRRALERERAAVSKPPAGGMARSSGLDRAKSFALASPAFAAAMFGHYAAAIGLRVSSSTAPAATMLDSMEFAELAGISPALVRRLCREGKLRSVRDKGYRIPRSELERLPDIVCPLRTDD